MKRRELLFASVAVPLVGAVGPAFGAEPEVFTRGGAAINGYDPVAYFTQSAPVRGREEHSLTWNGATWLFTSAEDLRLFQASPESYAPQYGGYCSYAVSEGYTAKTDPDAWTIHNGRLYLNYSLRVRDIWSRDIPGRIRAADANWPGVLG